MKFKKSTKYFGLLADRARTSFLRSGVHALDVNDTQGLDSDAESRKALEITSKYPEKFRRTSERLYLPVPTESPTSERVNNYDSYHNAWGLTRGFRLDGLKFKPEDVDKSNLYHYTPLRNTKSIINNGLLPSPYGTGISTIPANEDQIDKTGMYFREAPNWYLDGGFKFIDQPMFIRQISLLDGGKGGLKHNYNQPYVRFNIDGSDKNNVNYVNNVLPYEVRLKNKVTPDKLKLQVPYGAITRDNAQTYEDELKDVDPSKFDVNDTYTRRIYNLWAKKNNKPLLPGSEKYK